MKKKTVLFICTHNSARSQMAEGYLRVRYGTMFDVGSAGTEVRKVHPLAVAVMEEIGVDISGHRSKLIDEFFDRSPDIVVTVCDSARQACPFFPGQKRQSTPLFLILRLVGESLTNVTYSSDGSGMLSSHGLTRPLCRSTEMKCCLRKPV